MNREEYRNQARLDNETSAWVLRHCGGMYFGGFCGRPGEKGDVKWVHALAEAKSFHATALTKAEKYIERIKAKDRLYIGIKAVKVVLEAK